MSYLPLVSGTKNTFKLCGLALIALISIQNAGANLAFRDASGQRVKLEIAQSETQFTEDRNVFIEAFSRDYKTVPLEKFEHGFKSESDRKKWLGSVFDDELKLFKEGKSICVRAIRNGKAVGIVFFQKVAVEPSSVYVRQSAVSSPFNREEIEKHLIFSIMEDPKLLPETKTLFAIFRFINGAAIQFHKSIGFLDSSYMHEGYDPGRYTGFEWRRSK